MGHNASPANDNEPGGELLKVVRFYPSDEALIRLWLHGRPPTTQRGYRADAEAFLAHVQRPLDHVTLLDLQAWSDQLDAVAPRTKRRALSAIKSLFSFAHRTGSLQWNVGAALRLPPARSDLAERILEEADILRLIEAELQPRNHALLRFLYISGARISEACRLRWRDLATRRVKIDDVDAIAGQATLYGKGGKTRAVLLSPATWAVLVALRQSAEAGPNDPVFPSRQGGALTVRQALNVVKAAAERVGLSPDVSCHWFRHAHASHALDNGADLSLLRDTLGHSSLATTNVYVHARPNQSSGLKLRA